MRTQSEVVGNTVQILSAKSYAVLYEFNNVNTFGNKLISKIEDSIRLFFENMNSLLVNMT